MFSARTYEIRVYVEEEYSGGGYEFVESVHIGRKFVLLAEPVLLALLMGTGPTDGELRVAPERGLPPDLSLAVRLAATTTTKRPQHPTWLNPAELAEVETRYHTLAGKHEPHIRQLLDRMKGHSNWRVVVWLVS